MITREKLSLLLEALGANANSFSEQLGPAPDPREVLRSRLRPADHVISRVESPSRGLVGNRRTRRVDFRDPQPDEHGLHQYLVGLSAVPSRSTLEDERYL